MASESGTTSARTSVFVLGLDGADLAVVRPFVEAGKLPNLARLFQSGCVGPMESTNPPMSALAWSSFVTGVNPGKHGIFDFTARKPESYAVEFVNSGHRCAHTIWGLMTEAGRTVCVQGVPVSYPAEKVNGILISGFDSAGDAQAFHPPGVREEINKNIGDYIFSPRLRSLKESTPEEMLDCALESMRRKFDTALYLYAKQSWDCFMLTIGETDAIAHKLWKFHDPDCPHNSPGASAYTGPDPMLAIYETIDEYLGRFLERIRENTTLVIMSDHGHQGAGEKVIFPNRWLAERGLLRFRTAARGWVMSNILEFGKRVARRSRLPDRWVKAVIQRTPLAGQVESLLLSAAIDWSQTRAFSQETPYYATIWINLKGRDPEGIVGQGEEYEALRTEIIRALLDWKDPKTGDPVVLAAHRREDIYHGAHVDRAPDIIVEWSLDHGYSYLFQRSNGEGPAIRVLNDDERLVLKSGEHRVNGLLALAGARVAREAVITRASIMDLAPTLLYLMGLPVPSYMDGKVLTEVIDPAHLNAHPVAHREMDAGSGGDGGSGYTADGEAELRERLKSLGYL